MLLWLFSEANLPRNFTNTAWFLVLPAVFYVLTLVQVKSSTRVEILDIAIGRHTVCVLPKGQIINCS